MANLVLGRGRAIVLALLSAGLGALAALWLGHAGPFAPRAGRLAARVVDDATGAALAARVAVTDASGKAVEVGGARGQVHQLGKRWSYVDAAFTVEVPAGGATVEIRRGLETRPLVAQVSGGTGQQPAERTFRLRRWADLREAGYASGDIHAHIPALSDAPLEMRAEDLDSLNLLVLGGMPQPNDGSFTGRPDARSSAEHQIYLSQEIIDWHLGHLTLAGIKSLVPGYPVPCGTLEYWTSHPHCDVLVGGRTARGQGALVSLAHFENLPGAGTPVAVALGLLDALEIPTWSDPMQLPAHLSPWSASGMPSADFTPMRGIDLYYQLLNAGFRLPIAAGTDKSGEDIPIGSNRVYARTKGATDFASWLEGTKKGSGFATNGPLLEFDVGGAPAGDVVAFEGKKTLRARATARSILPFTTLEIVMNGRPVAHTLRLVQANAPVDGVYTLQAEATLTIEQSGWFAARAFADPDITPRLLPRGSSVFAHTNPVYFLRDGRPVREEASVLYLRKAVRGLLHWLSTRPAFSSEADREGVRRDAEQALRIYEGL